MSLFRQEKQMPTREQALPGHATPLFPIQAHHTVLETPLAGPIPEGYSTAVFGLGCFWGAERKFWQLEGVYTTAVGYAGGYTENATYEEVCSGRTGHAEVVKVVYDSNKITYEALLKTFWENHDPTQGNRQGGDIGTQYRSLIQYTTPDQKAAAEASRDSYQEVLTRAGHKAITTQIEAATPFYYAEPYHQQYLEKNPDGYCGIGGTGVNLSDPGEDSWGACPVGLVTTDSTATHSAE